jgi:hypothetical protein
VCTTGHSTCAVRRRCGKQIRLKLPQTREQEKNSTNNTIGLNTCMAAVQCQPKAELAAVEHASKDPLCKTNCTPDDGQLNPKIRWREEQATTKAARRRKTLTKKTHIDYVSGEHFHMDGSHITHSDSRTPPPPAPAVAWRTLLRCAVIHRGLYPSTNTHPSVREWSPSYGLTLPSPNHTKDATSGSTLSLTKQTAEAEPKKR